MEEKEIICYFTYRGKSSSYIHSSYVILGNYQLPEDVFEYADADYTTKKFVERLVDEQLAKQKDVVLVEICEFDED